ERYVSGVMSELNGKVTTDLTLTGTFSKPVFEGTVDFSRASCVVDYLNTRYSFTSRVLVKKNEFNLDGIKIIDRYNNEAVAKGKITHNYFTRFLFDVEVLPSKLQMLNTNAAQNSLYYGTAFVSGYAHFFGSIQSMNMVINLSPEKGTILNIPLNNRDDVSQSDFITFLDKSVKSDEAEPEVKRLVNLSGVKLNMNLDMNPNAMINIIFDEKIGDVISGTGTGSIRMDINTAGDFNMYGTYSIEKGDYLFTLQNLINKKFIVDRGSRITWAGSPYDATVDLSAVYVVNTSSLYKIIPDSTYKRRIPVDLRLLLTNKLMNPTINYDINVRGVDATEQTYIRSILNSEQEINKQMFGLLVLNQFISPSGTGVTSAGLDAGSGAGASASELLSNQVSNWLSQVSKDVNIGFNYRAKDTYSKEEIKVMFSKSLFNDRLTVEGNIGYSSNTPAQNNSNVVGDFNAEYKVSEDGRLRLKGFNRSNNENVINYTSPYTQGFGVFFRQEFNSIKDLLIRLHLMRNPQTMTPEKTQN
ncbi:MAG TPA: translocation/assembly module TamB domain-containing protein, partial [Bacteroidia bacterium]|nr:translocation/assembly module TamB domain-containing protein [Bacteroidia bacterium]